MREARLNVLDRGPLLLVPVLKHKCMLRTQVLQLLTWHRILVHAYI